MANDVFVGLTTGVLKLSGTTAPLKLGTVRNLRRLGPGGSATDGPVVVFLMLGASKLALVPVDVVMCHTRLKTARPASVFMPVLLTAFFSALTNVMTMDVCREVGLFGHAVLLFLKKVDLLMTKVVCFFGALSQSRVSVCSAAFTGIFLFLVVVNFVITKVEGEVGICSSFIRKTGRKFDATIHVVPCLMTVLMNVKIFHTSNTVSCLVSNVNGTMGLYNVSDSFMKTLPATLVGPLDKDKTQKLVMSTVAACNPSSFMNQLSYVFRNSASAAFCVLTMCFNDMKVMEAHRTIPYKLLTSTTKIVTTVLVYCLFFN